jgi:release factor glutamine methyltransferase
MTLHASSPDRFLTKELGGAERPKAFRKAFMSIPSTSHDQSVIVDRLRAAGCVFAEDEATLLIESAETPAGLADMVTRRVEGQPLEHVLGWAEFCGMRIAVEPGVFRPRPRTEFLIAEAVALARPVADPTQPLPADARTVVVDLCCGSGALGAALAAALPGVELHASDLDPVAVLCARRNVEPAGGQVYEGDLFEPLPATLLGRVDVLLANAPYVPTEDIELMPPEARLHEPRMSLDGGADGLEILRRVIAAAPQWLAPRGHVLVESSKRQAPQLVEAVARSGLSPRVATSDELNATVVIGARTSLRERRLDVGSVV